LDDVNNYIGTNDNVPLNFRTDSLFRMRLYQTGIININTFQVPNSGFLGISGRPSFFTNTPGPFSRLHLVDSIGNNNANIYAQSGSFRPWQRNGVTFTGNADHGYIGQKFNTLDRTDMVVHWANDWGAGQFAPDYLRFIFTGGYDSTQQTGARSLEGAEAMRLYPVNDTSIFVGVGDFFKATVDSGFNVRPNERLDVLDGRVRIRQLPTEIEADTLHRWVVVDENGVLGWRKLPDDLGADCDWVVGESPLEPHISTAFSGSSCDWDNRHGVGIGRAVPKAKLDVFQDDTELLSPIAIQGAIEVPPDSWTDLVGVLGTATQFSGDPTVQWSVGVRGGGRRGIFSIGVQGFGTMTASDPGVATVVGGVMGVAGGAGHATTAVGVYGTATGATNDYAGYFDGDIVVNGNGISSGTWGPSDAQFKTDVEELVNATELIAELRPKRYSFRNEEFPALRLPEGPQVGFIAQELEAVAPWAVKDFVHPGALFPTEGQEASSPLPFKGVNYTNLIPLLVAGMQEQQVMLEEEQANNAALSDDLAELRTRMDHLEQLLAACCNRPDGSQLAPQDELQKADPRTERLLRIDPNPFTDQTTVHYTLERGGRVSLLVHGSAGQHIQVLHEAPMEQGEYNQVWKTSHLAPGIYYVTLLLDGEPLVKRAVKVQ
jgi:hypothetical protein